MASKLAKPTVLYMSAAEIDNPEGAKCGHCMMFDKRGKCSAVQGKINSDVGVCGLYVAGEPENDAQNPMLSKATAGYIEDGPTHCGNCKFYGGNEQSGPCKIVEGTVEFAGCCNSWQREPSAPERRI